MKIWLDALLGSGLLALAACGGQGDAALGDTGAAAADIASTIPERSEEKRVVTGVQTFALPIYTPATFGAEPFLLHRRHSRNGTDTDLRELSPERPGALRRSRTRRTTHEDLARRASGKRPARARGVRRTGRRCAWRQRRRCRRSRGRYARGAGRQCGQRRPGRAA